MAADYTETITLYDGLVVPTRVPVYLDASSFTFQDVGPPEYTLAFELDEFLSPNYKGTGGGGSTRPSSGFLYPRGDC